MSAADHLNPLQFYHGTSTDRLDSIREHGLRGRDEGRVHLTTIRGEAEQYAAEYSNPALLGVRLPEEFPLQQGYKGKHHWVATETIGPEHIEQLS